MNASDHTSVLIRALGVRDRNPLELAKGRFYEDTTGQDTDTLGWCPWRSQEDTLSPQGPHVSPQLLPAGSHCALSVLLALGFLSPCSSMYCPRLPIVPLSARMSPAAWRQVPTHPAEPLCRSPEVHPWPQGSAGSYRGTRVTTQPHEQPSTDAPWKLAITSLASTLLGGSVQGWVQSPRIPAQLSIL